MPDRFFSQISLEVGQVVPLDPQQSHHLLHVLRAGVGDSAHLFDGGADAFLARVASKDRRTVRMEVLERIPETNPTMDRIVVAAPVPKGDRFRYLVEKLTEIGVAAYLPVQTKRSVNPLSSSLQQKVEQWVVEACKQCGRNSLLQTLEPLSLTKFLEATGEIPERWVACAPSDLPVLDPALGATANTAKGAEPATTSPASSGAATLGGFSQVLLVGPEGGFTEDEIREIHEQGWAPLSLGTHVLRIETAALAGAVVLLNRAYKPVSQPS